MSVMTSSNKSSVLKGILKVFVFATYTNPWLTCYWVYCFAQCVYRCCCLCWCVVIRKKSKLFKHLHSAAGRNGSWGKTAFSHDCLCSVYILCFNSSLFCWKVSQRFNKRITHVVFHNGHQATWRKAKTSDMIRLVSLLWVQRWEELFRVFLFSFIGTIWLYLNASS